MQIGRDPVGTRQTHAVVPTGRGAGVASPDHAVERVVAERLVLADDAEVREPLMLDCEVRITHRIALGAAGRHHPGRRPLPAHQRPPPAVRWFSLALAGLSSLRLILRR